MTVRKRGGDIEKVMGSCKQDQACKNNEKHNFDFGKECRPEETLDENDAKVVSVCRSCSDSTSEQLTSASFSTDADWKTNLL
ncbi:unnamed protein product [Oikopleura dioica]|nr:unnamed protein product [Oikopleura dioica]CBY37881.1 unnamed protein product [Oikopleura dioica]